MLELLPRRGLGPMRFGMRPSEVQAVFDEPEAYDEWMGGNRNDALLRRGLILGFDVCDAHGPLPHARLRYIDIWVPHRPDVVLWGTPLAEWTRAQLLAHAERHGIALEPRAPGMLHSFTEGMAIHLAPDGRVEALSAWPGILPLDGLTAAV